MINNSLDSISFIDLNMVPKYSETPIQKIPKYVFENCNQVTCHNYTESLLEKIKVQSKTTTNQFLKICLPKEEERIKKAEEIDWVYGLTILEEEFLSNDQFIHHPTFTLEQIMRINGLLSRLCNESPGEIRKKGIHWPKTDVSLTENVALQRLESFVCLFFDGDGKDSSEKAEEWFAHLSTPGSTIKEISFKTSDLRIYLQYLKAHPETYTIGSEQYKGQTIDPQLTERWLIKYGVKQKKVFSVNKCLKDYYHYFTAPQKIEEELKATADMLDSLNMHPIEKASRIWFDIVRIHISHEANKRTGKALASAILLANGYLPPIITKEDTTEYIKTLEKSLEEENGVLKFTNFIARKIIETQNKFS